MFSKYLTPFLFLGVLFIYSGCDPTTSPKDPTAGSPYVSYMLLSPNEVIFTASGDGFKDTTLTISIQAQINLDSLASDIGYVVRNKDTEEVFTQGELTKTDFGYFGNFDIETSTTSFENYFVEVYAFDEFGDGNYYQSELSIRGASNEPPVILWADNPAEVPRPASGTTTVSFTAKATDPEGQHTIEGVFMRLISQVSGEVDASPFRMYDNGSAGSDQVAQDSVFTVSFNIASTNNLETYDIEYYAVDLGGLVSDTVRTTFSIVEN